MASDSSDVFLIQRSSMSHAASCRDVSPRSKLTISSFSQSRKFSVSPSQVCSQRRGGISWRSCNDKRLDATAAAKLVVTPFVKLRPPISDTLCEACRGRHGDSIDVNGGKDVDSAAEGSSAMVYDVGNPLVGKVGFG